MKKNKRQGKEGEIKCQIAILSKHLLCSVYKWVPQEKAKQKASGNLLFNTLFEKMASAVMFPSI